MGKGDQGRGHPAAVIALMGIQGRFSPGSRPRAGMTPEETSWTARSHVVILDSRKAM
jgi:hypothetical protein